MVNGNQYDLDHDTIRMESTISVCKDSLVGLDKILLVYQNNKYE